MRPIPQLNCLLLEWFDREKRPMPWRGTTDLYRVWLSEVMLQQTRVSTVMPYYERWLTKFPTMQSVANAAQSELLVQWQGLGYYQRCLSIQVGIRQVLKDGAPKSVEEWLRLPGVGPYTAAALASNCQGEPAPAVDGNVMRVVSRLRKDFSPIPKLRKRIEEWGRGQIDRSRPGDWNQAMMELGGLICLPKAPRCAQCPLEGLCEGKAVARELPVRAIKGEMALLRFLVHAHISGGEVGVTQETNPRWWRGLWVLPNEELSCEPEDSWLGPVKGTVTNNRIQLYVKLHEGAIPPGLVPMPLADLSSFALPAPYRRAVLLALESRNQKGCLPLISEASRF